MEDYEKDIDGRRFYLNLKDAQGCFNQIEITLSHLFRIKHPVLQDRTYSDCLYEFLDSRNYLRRDIIEVGCGLGDLAANLIERDQKRGAIESYTAFDISPTLLKVTQDRLVGQRQFFELS